MSNKNYNRKYKCLYCDNKYDRQELVSHVGKKHLDELPEGYTPLRIVFNYVNKYPLNYNGKCTECGGPTRWDENKGRYDRQCSKKACHDSYIKKFEENMKKKHGTDRISKTDEGQKKMLSHRKISGTYKFRDGVEKEYCGSYELKALEFMDKVLEINSYDILAPGPVLEYKYENQIHKYISDFYYQPYNLIIEVKDGGDNPNKRNMPEYRAKQIAKEEFIVKNTNYNYIRLTNNNFEQLLAVFMDLKLQLVENTGARVIHINENSLIYEYMNALTTGKVPGIRDSGAYIVNYSTNRVFNDEDYDKLAVTDDPSMTNLIGINKDGILTNIDKKEIKEAKLYKLNISLKELNERLSSLIDKEVDDKLLYEIVTGYKYYCPNQIKNQLVREQSLDEYIKECNSKLESIFDINKKSDFENLNESISEVSKWINLM